MDSVMGLSERSLQARNVKGDGYKKRKNAMMGSNPSLLDLGWCAYFEEQLQKTESVSFSVGRIIEQHRSHLLVASEKGTVKVSPSSLMDSVCVGDWVLFDDGHQLRRLLTRQSLFSRKAPGSKVGMQLIAANIDTLLIVSSLNDDFNLNRIERFLSLAKEAKVEPVVILTKADLCLDEAKKRKEVQSLDPFLSVHSINALDKAHLSELSSYCQTGKTVAFMGSSGVGKSTLMNGLLGAEIMQTAGIREDDSKGRHTTTFRTMKWLEKGGLLMDTPGMRELQLSDCEQGISETFSEIAALAEQCRFSDCQHAQEPDCAIQKAIQNESLSLRRFENYQKLMREQAFNGATLAQKREKDKAFGKMISRVQTQSRIFKKGE